MSAPFVSKPSEREVKNSCGRGFTAIRLLSSKRLHARMEGIRASVLAEFCVGFEQDDQLIKHAIDEAETLAWKMGSPQLLFPELAIEKARSVAASLAR
jgi:hypothetical protein